LVAVFGDAAAVEVLKLTVCTWSLATAAGTITSVSGEVVAAYSL
jgi:hypothetical protein